jgi:hypothetical protein
MASLKTVQHLMARVRWIAGVSAILNVIGAQMDASSHDLDVQPDE